MSLQTPSIEQIIHIVNLVNAKPPKTEHLATSERRCDFLARLYYPLINKIIDKFLAAGVTITKEDLANPAMILDYLEELQTEKENLNSKFVSTVRNELRNLPIPTTISGCISNFGFLAANQVSARLKNFEYLQNRIVECLQGLLQIIQILRKENKLYLLDLYQDSSQNVTLLPSPPASPRKAGP